MPITIPNNLLDNRTVSAVMTTPFVYSLGDYVGIIRGRSAGVKGRVTQIRKKVLVVSVRSKRASYRVKPHSMVLLKKSSMNAAPPVSVETKLIKEYIDDELRKDKLNGLTLGEWRRLQKGIEQKLFDVDD